MNVGAIGAVPIAVLLTLAGCNSQRQQVAPSMAPAVPVAKVFPAAQSVTAQVAQPGEPNFSDNKSAERCSDLLQRTTEIDNGAMQNEAQRFGPIRKTDAFNHKDEEEYNALKDCYRRKNVRDTKPDLTYDGMGEFRTRIKFRMSPQQLADALPMLPQELVGTASAYDIKTNPYLFHWVLEGCIKSDPSEDKFSNVRSTCMFSKPITGSPRVAAITGAPFPDSVMFDFDRVGPEGKLLAWRLTFSVPIESYKTTSAVIRYERDHTSLGELGPPDDADSANATWYFYAGNKELESFSIRVQQKERAFVVSVDATDLEHERVEQQPESSFGASQIVGDAVGESETSVRNAVAAWVSAFSSKNPTLTAECYAPLVETYFLKHNLSRAQIEAYLASAFAQTVDMRKYEVRDVQVTFLPSEQKSANSIVYSRAIATFHKEWETKESDGKTFQGEEIEQLTLTSSPQGWKIVREEEKKIIRVSRK
jgi:hypothetical protein